MSKLEKAKKVTSNILSIIILSISIIIICVAYYITKYLKDINVYEVIYHLKTNISGSGSGIIADGIKVCILVFILLFILVYIPITDSKNKKITIYNKKNKKEINLYPNIFNKYKITYSLIILTFSLTIFASTINFTEFVSTTNKSSDIYDNYYVDTNKVKIEMPKIKKNLILIYLESMESSLMSTKNGGAFEESRIPELEEIAKKNINFSNTEKLGGGYNLTNTRWSIAGVVASTTGTPLNVTVGNSYNKVEEFMPNVNALGDILKEEGYNLEIIQGMTVKFAGTDKYFIRHGNYKLIDGDYLKKEKILPEDYNVGMGMVEDKKILEYAKEEITELSEQDEPFAVSLFTIDTHFRDGYLDPSCDEPFDDQMSNVFACSSKMVNDFIIWLKEQDFYDDTVVVILGDHLTMQGDYFNSFPYYTRTIYNAFLNVDESKEFTKNREFSSLDMYPTILASLGAKIDGDQLGFGVNLFSGKKTMIEKLGKEKFDKETLKKSKYYIENIQKVPGFDDYETEYEEE